MKGRGKESGSRHKVLASGKDDEGGMGGKANAKGKAEAKVTEKVGCQSGMRWEGEGRMAKRIRRARIEVE